MTTNEHAERAELISSMRTLANTHTALSTGSDLEERTAEALRKALALLEAQPAEQAKGQEASAHVWKLPSGMKIADIGFRWDGESRQHIPHVLVQFEPVPANSPNDAKGWEDRDSFAAMLSSTPPAHPAREWVGLTDEERLHFVSEILDYGTGFIAPIDAVVCNIESKLREKNAGLFADQANGKEHGHIGWLSRNRAGKLEMLTDLEIDASNGEWSRLFKLYTHPQPQAEVRVPDGWHFNTADFSMQAQGKSSTGSVMLIRDTKGLRAWCMLSDDDRDRVELYVSGKGTTVLEAIADASSKAIIAAAPKPKD